MEIIFKGKRIEVSKETCLNGVQESIIETLQAPIPDTRQVVASLDKLGKFIVEEEEFLLSELMELGFSRDEALEIKKESIGVLCADELFRKIKRELKEFPFELNRLAPREEQFEAWMPLGVLGHVTSSNDAMLPLSKQPGVPTKLPWLLLKSFAKSTKAFVLTSMYSPCPQKTAGCFLRCLHFATPLPYGVPMPLHRA